MAALALATRTEFAVEEAALRARSDQMKLLVTTGHPDFERFGSHAAMGRLIQPRHTSSIERTSAAGITWAADNDCFQGLDAVAYTKMLDRIKGLSGCVFVTVPDVVAEGGSDGVHVRAVGSRGRASRAAGRAGRSGWARGSAALA